MPIDVFISHSHKDKTTSDAMCAVLEQMDSVAGSHLAM